MDEFNNNEYRYKKEDIQDKEHLLKDRINGLPFEVYDE